MIAWMLALSGVGVLARLMVHEPNFAPMTALALVAGYYLPKKWGVIVPLTAVLLSDLVLGFYDLPVMAAVYASYVLSWLMAKWARSTGSASALVPATLLSSVLFFVATNAAVWAFTPMYAKTTAGLYQAYAMAVPFFKWTLASDIFYTTAFVGVITLAQAYARRGALAKQQSLS